MFFQSALVRRRIFNLVLVVLLTITTLPMGVRPLQAAGNISLTTLGVAYTQDFNTLASSGTSNIVPTGWEFSESGNNANTFYAAGTGSSNAGDTYSFGSTAATERAFGGLRSGNLIPLIGAQFINNTGQAITALTIAYTGEQWRLGQNTTGRAADRLDFQLSVDATSLTSGTWSDQNSLDFASPVVAGAIGALNGNNTPNRTSLSFTLTSLNIADGATFWIRWADSDLIPGSDDGLAVDDFSLTPFTADAAPMVSGTVPGNNAAGVALDANLTVNFSEPVTVSDPWFSIACSLSGAHTASVTGGPTNFSLDPDVDFVNGDTCTVTVIATQVIDQDVNDPPDFMDANHAWSFTTPACSAPATFIHDIQGSGLTSPMNGATNVVVEGIVVGDYQGPGQFSGFHLQEEDADADADPTTSEGLFVFNTSFAVNAGDKVRLKGNVLEFSTSGVFLTELTNVTSAEICSTGHSVTPAVINLPVSNLNAWEAYEGMQVSLPQDLTVTENFTLGRFGEVSLSVGGRLFNPTSLTTPGAAALALQDLNNRRRIVLDDGNNQQNIDPTFYPAGGLSAANTLRSGDTINGLAGVLEQRFGVYRVQPIGAVNFNAANPRSSTPDSVGGSLKVAAMNVLNYFNGNGLGGGFPTSRGASTALEFTRQRAKIINAIIGLNADIVGLMELENDAAPNSAIEDLVAGLNASAGAGTYSFINTGIVGTDAIRVGLLYKPARVTPVGAFAILDSSVDPLFLDTKNRPVLAQTFAQNANGQQFTVAVNHLKSKGSDCNDVDDPDTGDGQGNCNLTRTNAAIALVNWLATDPTGSGDPDFLIIGDLNSYAKEDPIAAIENGGYTNLLDTFLGSAAYSFVFQGQSGYLDHALANATFTAQVTGATEWHINADEPIALDYNTEFKSANHVTTLYATTPYRSSDHDPVLVGVCQSPTATVSVTPNLLWPPNHKYRTVEATVGVSGDVSTITLVSVTSDEPDNGQGDGDTPNDIVIVDNDTFKLRAERSGGGDGRVYTITYQVTNTCGQSIVITATVTVPHNN